MTDKPWLKFYDKGVPESLKPYPEKTLQQFLEESAAKYPDNVAIHFKPSHQGFAPQQIRRTGIELRGNPPINFALIPVTATTASAVCPTCRSAPR